MVATELMFRNEYEIAREGITIRLVRSLAGLGARQGEINYEVAREVFGSG
jgi:hypothetical protein